MIYVRWRDEDDEKYVTTNESSTDQTWDLSRLPPLRAGMTVSVGGVQMILHEPNAGQ